MIRDSAVLELLSGHNALLDALLTEVIVRGIERDANVNLRFSARSGSDFSEVVIKFTEVIEFEFEYDEAMVFLDVWDLKFLELKDGTFYIALDPDPATLPSAGVLDVGVSERDHFFVRARHIEAVVVLSSLDGSGPARVNLD